MQTKQRMLNYDLMRITASFAVVVLHMAAQKWYTLPPQSWSWIFCDIYNSLSRFCVPVFLMLSGAMFLPPEKPVPTKKLYTRYIPRLLVAYIVWCVVYAAVLVLTGNALPENFWNLVYRGRYHLIFLPALISLYIALPALRAVVRDKKATEYFLLVCGVVGFALPTLMNIPLVQQWVWPQISKLNFGFFWSYIGYFMLGYYLRTYPPGKKIRRAIYISGIICSLIIIIVTYLVSVKTGSPYENLYVYGTVFILAQATAVFCFFSQIENKLLQKWAGPIQMLSKCSFGVYLVHDIFIVLLAKWGFDAMWLHPMISVPLLSVVVTLLSFGVSWVLNKIPLLSKWIV